MATEDSAVNGDGPEGNDARLADDVDLLDDGLCSYEPIAVGRA